MQEIISYIESCIYKISTNEEFDENKICLILSILHVMIENCPNLIANIFKQIAMNLVEFSIQIKFKTLKIHLRLTNCWNSLIRFKKELFFDSMINDSLFSFLLNNFKFKNYDISFISMQLLHFIIFEEDKTDSTSYNLQRLMNSRIKE